MHDNFYDRVITAALGRGVTQYVFVGAGHDGRVMRYTQPGTRWWDVGGPAAPAGERANDGGRPDAGASVTFIAHDLNRGLGDALTGSGFEPDSPALFCCEAGANGLSGPALAELLAELRSLATPGTRLALALPPETADGPQTSDLLGRSRWRAVEISERAQRAGLRMLVPAWAPAAGGTPPSAGRIAAFIERVLYRSGGDRVAGHLEAAYGVTAKRSRELDLGVHRVDLAGGTSWIARVFPAAMDVGAVRDDAQLLAWLAAAGFPAERCARPEPVSVLDGQPVLVTELAPGRPLPGQPASFELLGRFLGRLHTADPGGQPAARRPGGAWHHLLPAGSPAQEVTAARTLLHEARHRVAAGDGDRYDALVAALDASDGCADLPHALVHPDCVPRNAIGQPGGDVTIIDWTGTGRGPRIVSFGCLLWAAAGDQGNVAAAISGYRHFVTLEPGEVDRLGAAMRLRPLILACWAFATGRDKLENVTGGWEHHTRRIDTALKHARLALQQGA